MLIYVGSVAGGVGVTTFTLALAWRWPDGGPAPLVVELDPSGGDLATRWHTRGQPGLPALVWETRQGRHLGDARAWAHKLMLRNGSKDTRWTAVDVVLAPPADAAAAVITEFTESGPAALRQLATARPVLVDVGRLDPHTPVVSFLDTADEALLVVRPTLDQLRHAAVRLPVLHARCSRIRLVLAGTGPYPPAEIAAQLGVPVAVHVPGDSLGAAVASGAAPGSLGWTRRPLFAAAHTLARTYARDSSPRRVSPSPAGQVARATS